jgi:hypothetical protein
MRGYYTRNRDKIIAQRRYRYHNDGPYREAMKWRVQREQQDIKLWVLTVYGNVECRCCGEYNPVFLTIDHINGGGTQGRKKHGGGSHFYKWLIQQGCPPGYQVLCFNCNCGRAVNGGVCPHVETT